MVDKKTNLIVVNPTLNNLINVDNMNVFVYDVNGILSLLDNSNIFDFTTMYVNDYYIQRKNLLIDILIDKDKHKMDYVNVLFMEWLNIYVYDKKHNKTVITLDEFVNNNDIHYLRSMFGRFVTTLKNIFRKSVYLVRLPENLLDLLDLLEQLNMANNNSIVLVNIDRYFQQMAFDIVDIVRKLIELFNNNGYDVHTIYNIIDDTIKLTNLDLSTMKNSCIITRDGRIYYYYYFK